MNRFDGFHEFVVARGGALSRTAFLLTGEHHAAEDLVQSALAKAAARWRQIMEYGQPEAYVRRTMINEHISWWRRRPARPMAEVPERPGSDEPHQVVDRVVLGRALNTLTPRQRAVVVLRYYEDLTEAETATALGCSVGTVKSQTHIALNNLRAALPMFAEQAARYADPDAAVARARRSRPRRVAVGAALAVVPLGLVAALFVLRGDPVPPPATPSPSPSASALAQVPPLPTQVPDPGAAVSELPRDRGVGPASLLRYDDTAEPGKLRVEVLAGGSWYRLTIPDLRIAFPADLSPDGRLLVWTTAGGTVVRDLTGTDERVLPFAGASRWSPSGRWLLGFDGSSRNYVRVEMPDGTPLAALRQQDEASVAGVLDSGELLRMVPADRGDQPALEVIEPGTRNTRPLTVDVGKWLKQGEHAETVIASPEGVRAIPLARTYVAANGTAAIEVRDERGAQVLAYLEFSLADGRVLRRHDMTQPRPDELSRLVCHRGTEVFWRRGDTLHARPDSGGAVTTVALPPGRYRLPGCWGAV